MQRHVSHVGDGLRVDEMHTAAAGAADLGEEVRDAHGGLPSRASEACPGGCEGREGRRWAAMRIRRPDGCGDGQQARVEERAATCNGDSAVDVVLSASRRPCCVLGPCPTQLGLY